MLQKLYEELMDRYQEIKREVRQRDPHLFERWKAGGFLVDEDIISSYPHLGTVVESLIEDTPEDD